MSPEWGDLQQQTDWRALSGDIPFSKRFDPNGPYAKAFEAGGWDVMKQQLANEKMKEKKKQVGEGMFQRNLLSNFFHSLPGLLKRADEKGPFSIVAKPSEDSY